MELLSTSLQDAFLLKPRIFTDERGLFYETTKASTFHKLGLPHQFLQDNISVSKHGVIRGLHFQKPATQGKLVTVVKGEAYDVMVDLRQKSLTFGQWFGANLSDQNRLEIWIPEGFAHGFMVLSAEVILSYKCTREYDPGGEYTLAWNDPELNISWPSNITPVLSTKDQVGLTLAECRKRGLCF